MHHAPVVLCLLAAAWPAALCQNPVPIQFQTSPVLVRTGAAAVLEVITVSNALSINWVSPKGITLGLWVGGQAVLSTVSQYAGRISITATQLQISPVFLTDTGNYTVIVDPGGIVGMTKSSRSVLLHVFDAVAGVKLSVPPVALEGGNISLTCTWTMGTEMSTIWEKGGTAISPDYRIRVTDNSLVINPGNRSDAGVYSCTVSNLVSAVTATASLTVYYGPDAPILQQNLQANCVGGGQAVVGQTVQLTCTSVSLPAALFSWQQNGQSVAADQVNGGVLTLQAITTSQSGQYVCMARNAVTTQTAKQSIDITIVNTCLSVGAVAGIVVACVLAIIFIIIGIILLLCRRKRDSRLRGDKPSPSSVPVTGPLQPAPQSNRAPAGYSDPPLHSPNMLPDGRQQYAHTSPPPQPNGPATRGLQGNPAGPVSNHGRPDGGGLPPGGSYDPESPRNRTQTGHAPPGSVPPLIHLTLNTIQPTEHIRSDGQPQAVHLNLNAYPYPVRPNPLQNSDEMHLNTNGANTPQQGNRHTVESGLSQTPPVQRGGGAHNAPLISTSSVENQAPTRDAVIQTSHTHVVNYGRTGQQDARTQTYWSEAVLPSHRRRPWDWLRSTPAYPNRSVASHSSSSSCTQSSPEPIAAQPGNGPQNDTVLAARGPQSQTGPRAAQPGNGPQNDTVLAARGPQSQTGPRAAQPGNGPQNDTVLAARGPQSQTRPRAAQPGNGPQNDTVPAARGPQSQTRPRAAQPGNGPQNDTVPAARGPQSQTRLRAAQLGNGPQNDTVPAARGPQSQTRPRAAQLGNGPQNDTVPAARGPQSHSQTQVSVNTQTNNPEPQVSKMTWVPTPLIQAAPQNPVTQTQAALPAYGAKPRDPFQTQNQPKQPVRAQKTQPSAKRPPTPPPVLPLSQFKALPRQRLPEKRPVQQLRPQRETQPKRSIGIVQPSPHWNARHGPAHMQGPAHKQDPAHTLGQPHSHMHAGTQKQVFHSRMRY